MIDVKGRQSLVVVYMVDTIGSFVYSFNMVDLLCKRLCRWILEVGSGPAAECLKFEAALPLDVLSFEWPRC